MTRFVRWTILTLIAFAVSTATAATAHAQQMFTAGPFSFLHPHGWTRAGTGNPTDSPGILLYPAGTPDEGRRIQFVRLPQPTGALDDMALHSQIINDVPRRYPGLKVDAPVHQSIASQPGNAMTSVLRRTRDGLQVGLMTVILRGAVMDQLLTWTDRPAEVAEFEAAHRMILRTLRVDGSTSREFEKDKRTERSR
jgi:hypothetical protein